MTQPSTQTPKINTQRILKLADLMDKIADLRPASFNQTNYGMDLVERLTTARPSHELPALDWSETECGANACIAGWAVVLSGTQRKLRQYQDVRRDQPSIPEYARILLGLTDDQAHELFTAIPYANYTPTAGDAARVLRHLASTGEADWQAARQDKLSRTNELAAHILKVDIEDHEAISLALEDKWNIGYDTPT